MWLVTQLPKTVAQVYGDGAYDGIGFRQAVQAHGANPCVPPPKGAVVKVSNDPAVHKRNDAIKEIVGLGGDAEAKTLWKKLKGYHKRSLVETTMYRLKCLTGSRLRSREPNRQRTEAFLKCLALNKTNRIGMPEQNAA